MPKQVEKRIVLTKSAAKEFAAQLYHTNGNSVTYTKLCDSNLKQGKLHCVIGEAYHMFVSTSLQKVLRKDCPTENAIDALVEAASLKKGVSKERLDDALSACVSANDSSYEEVGRARAVAETWLKQVVPLLK